MSVTIKDVRDAYERIQGHIHMTPVMTCSAITANSPFPQIYLKCENFQKVGAFKIRGALNAVLKAKERHPEMRDVVTHSSGNHAQAIALASRVVGVRAHIVMPSNAPTSKLEATKGYGAEVVRCQPVLASRESTAREVLARHPGSVFIHPFDNADVMAGQGTISLELDKQLPKDVAAIIVPVGGGGLLSGVATAMKALRPDVMVIGAEPSGADDASRSFRSRKVEPHRDGNPNTMADGLLTTLCPRTLDHILRNVDDIVTVSEAEIARALRLVLERAKLVIEPSAAVGVAVALSGRVKLTRRGSVAVVLCGGNVDLEALPSLLAKGKL